MIFGLQSCSTQKQCKSHSRTCKNGRNCLRKTKNKEENCFKNAADRPELYLPLLKNKNCSNSCQSNEFISRQNAFGRFLVQNNIKIKHIFAPEHGFRGTADAGEHVKTELTPKQVYRLFRFMATIKTKIWTITRRRYCAFDIQDVGVRFTRTFLHSLMWWKLPQKMVKKSLFLTVRILMMVIQDGCLGKMDKFVQDYTQSSCSLWINDWEYGKWVNGEKWMKNAVQVKYTLIPMLNYHKIKISGFWKPRPIYRNDQSINLYPSLVSSKETQGFQVGRGTDFPFQSVQSPWIQKPGIWVPPKPTSGAKRDPF